jgi:hypothetical protein
MKTTYGTILGLLVIITVLVYVFGSQINELLKSEIADRVLLIVLIVVDASGPFLFAS